jgi:hypothetical protein
VGIKTHSRQPLLPPAFLEAEAAIPAQPLSEAINGEELPGSARRCPECQW